MKERKRVPFRLHEGSCIDSLKLYPDDHFDSCVTDPPYEFGFMGKKWDSSGIAFQKSTWEAVLRVMKPGAHLLAFGGTRTYHRMVCAIEDAGFEVRDCVMWLYGSGFPKSLNASKAIDEHLGFEREVTREATAPAIRGGVYGGDMSSSEDRERRDKPVSLQAVQWDGWGTALKPAAEPVVWARKPLEAMTEWVTIGRTIATLWSELWLMFDANDAERFSALSPVAYGVEPSAFVRWGVEQRFSTRVALSEAMGTLRFGTALVSCLSTVCSWSGILAASCPNESTFTTETELKTTTDWRTLRFSLSKITPENIIAAHKSGQWLSANACSAAKCSSAIVAALRATLELSAAESVIAKQHLASLAVDVSPAWEPIVVARKPLHGNVAQNVLAFGTGAINIDGCRVGAFVNTTPSGVDRRNAKLAEMGYRPGAYEMGETTPRCAPGRWPANVIHDGSDDVMVAFPDAPGALAPVTGNEPNASTLGVFGDYAARALSTPREVRPSTTATSFRPQPGQKHYTPRRSAGGRNQAVWKGTGMFAADATNNGVRSFGDDGSAARFFKECSWNSSDADTAVKASSLPSRFACIAQNAAAILGAQEAVLREPLLPPLSTNVTESELKLLQTTLIEAIVSIVNESLPGLLLEKHSRYGNLVRVQVARTQRPIDIMTITTSLSSSDGSVVAATFDITLNTASGEGKRFIYSAKASQQDRNEGLAVRGNHPTVKPTDLMRYLCKLVTQPNGLVLDPFCGSGSTGKAAMFEGFRFAGMDLDESHIALSRARMLWALKELVVRDPFGFGD